MNYATYTLAFAAASANNIAQSQSPGAGAITLNGTVGTGNLDAARRIIVTSGGNDSGITFTVIGKNRDGASIQQTLTGGNAAAVATTLDFLSVSSVTHTGSIAGTVTVGTNGVGSSQWFMLNTMTNPVNVAVGVIVTGTINFSIEYTYQDPNTLAVGIAPTVWTQSALASKTANTDGSFTFPCWGFRLTQNSFTNPGTASATFYQAGIG